MKQIKYKKSLVIFIPILIFLQHFQALSYQENLNYKEPFNNSSVHPGKHTVSTLIGMAYRFHEHFDSSRAISRSLNPCYQDSFQPRNKIFVCSESFQSIWNILADIIYGDDNDISLFSSIGARLESEIYAAMGMPYQIFRNEDDNDRTHPGRFPTGFGQELRDAHLQQRINRFHLERMAKMRDWQKLHQGLGTDPLKHALFRKKIEKINTVLTCLCQKSTSKEIIEVQVLDLLDLAKISFDVPSLDKTLQKAINQILNQLYDKNGSFIGIHDESTLEKVTWIVANYLKENSYNSLTLEVAEILFIQTTEDEHDWFHKHLHGLVELGLPFQPCLDVEHSTKGFFANTRRVFWEALINFDCDAIIYDVIQQDRYTECLRAVLTTNDLNAAESRVNAYIRNNHPDFFTGKTRKKAEWKLSHLEQVLQEKKQELMRESDPFKRPDFTIEDYLMQEFEKLASSRGFNVGDEIFDEIAAGYPAEHITSQEIREICQTYILDAELFQDQDSDNLSVKKNLLCSLKHLSASKLDPGSKILFRQMTFISLDLIEKQRPDLAQSMIDSMYVAGSILFGAASEYVLIRGFMNLQTLR